VDGGTIDYDKESPGEKQKVRLMRNVTHNRKRLCAALLVCAMLVLPLSGMTRTATAQSASVIALVGGTVIDGNGGAPLRDAVVLISGSRILKVGAKDKARIPKSAKIIDATGRFIIPGLIDLHVHYDGWMGELFLAHGVTTIKDLGNDAEWCQKFAADIEQGRARGPRFFYVGNGIDAPPPVRDHHIALGKPELAARAVELLHQRGVAAIKMREKSSPELMRAVTQRAHQLGIPVTAHIVNINVRDAARAGIDGLEHATGIVAATATQHSKPDPNATDVQRFINELKGFAHIDSAKAEELARFLAAKKVALIPTMANWWRFASERKDEFARVDAEYAKNPALAYVPGHIRQVWATSFLYEVKNADDLAQVKAGWRKTQAYLKPFHKAGGKVLAGSDTLLSVPGLSLLRELMMLVDVGFTPMQAITIGSRDNSQFLGQGKNLGTITPGKLADLVILDADPLADIRHLQRVVMVFKNGQEVDRSYHADYSVPTPKPKLTRPLWIEKLLMEGKSLVQ
jgi:imidazolonepropionase-like amidohydrolase